jgi:SAM-dependent methyltransferase
MTTTDESQLQRDHEIQQTVSERYGAIADRVLSETTAAEQSGGLKIEFLERADAAASCCGADGSDGDACCGPAATELSTEDALTYGSRLYSEGETSSLPTAAVSASLGCGNPVAIAELNPGERVLDLGSGGGIDCFLSAQQVGADGEVWGLDMTPSMVRLARRNAEKVEATNVHFRLGEIEDMPFESDHFDAIISNCVINLSTDKAQVFREAFRVLKPGGRLRVSDMVWTKDVPIEERGDAEAWAGCVAGALPLSEYLAAIEAAGFVDAGADYEESERGIASAYVSAVKPA